MRTDLESDLRLGCVHLNRPSSTSHCPLKTARARRIPVHTHICSSILLFIILFFVYFSKNLFVQKIIVLFPEHLSMCPSLSILLLGCAAWFPPPLGSCCCFSSPFWFGFLSAPVFGGAAFPLSSASWRCLASYSFGWCCFPPSLLLGGACRLPDPRRNIDDPNPSPSRKINPIPTQDQERKQKTKATPKTKKEGQRRAREGRANSRNKTGGEGRANRGEKKAAICPKKKKENWKN